MTNNKIQLYRAILKVLTLIGISILGYFLIRSAVMPTNISTESKQAGAIHVDLSTLLQGQIKIIQWDNKNIAILHRTEAMQEVLINSLDKSPYFVFKNAGGDINCPLVVDQTTKIHLKDICSAYLYDTSGKVIKTGSKAQDLIIPPHHIEDKLLILGEN